MSESRTAAELGWRDKRPPEPPEHPRLEATPQTVTGFATGLSVALAFLGCVLGGSGFDGFHATAGDWAQLAAAAFMLGLAAVLAIADLWGAVRVEQARLEVRNLTRLTESVLKNVEAKR